MTGRAELIDQLVDLLDRFEAAELTDRDLGVLVAVLTALQPTQPRLRVV